MTTDQWLVSIILVVALAVFISDRFRVDVVALSVLVTLVLTGVLDSTEALSGLSNPAVVTVFAVFILSGALVATGVADELARLTLRVAGRSQWRVIVVLMATCGLMSAFMNNIGATAILLPAALLVAERTGIAPSKLLMPLAFSSLLGGNITAIGTPPNILANGIMSERPDLEPFGFFEFAPTGIPVLLVGLLYMATVGTSLLPSRSESGRLTDSYGVDDYLSSIAIGQNSSLVGRTIAAVQQQFDGQVQVLRLQRRGEDGSVTPRQETIVEAGDLLTVQASLSSLAEFGSRHGAEVTVDHGMVAWTTPLDGRETPAETIDILEVMVAPESTLIGSTPRQLELRRRRGLIALALRRRRGPIQTDLFDIELRAGDSLVVTGQRDRLRDFHDSDDVIVLNSPDISIRDFSRAPMAVLVLICALGAAALGLVSIAIAMLTGALVLVLTGVISMEDAYAAVDWKAIFLIAGMLPMGTAMQSTGTAQLLADRIVDLIGGAGPLWVMLGIYLLTVALTSVISNAAATVLLVPIAIDSAATLDADPRPFVMATVIGRVDGLSVANRPPGERSRVRPWWLQVRRLRASGCRADGSRDGVGRLSRACYLAVLAARATCRSLERGDARFECGFILGDPS